MWVIASNGLKFDIKSTAAKKNTKNELKKTKQKKTQKKQKQNRNDHSWLYTVN